jgi:tRNA1Val (adenine37-N6)-methyltransferase
MDSTVDGILYGVLRLRQPRKGPRVSLDSVLLAAWARPLRRGRVLELGSAQGGDTLMVALRHPDLERLEGLEIQEPLYRMALENAEANGLPATFRLGDLRNHRELYEAQSFDLVIANPPYDDLARGRKSAVAAAAMARQETACRLEDVVEAARYLLCDGGRLSLVFRADRLAELLTLLKRFRLEPKRLRAVHHSPEKEASIILVEAVRSAALGLRLERPLFVIDAEGRTPPDLAVAYEAGKGACL